MTLQQLEYIVAVAQTGHFSKAAELCHVTQPTLSSMVQKLEDELGVRIFDRNEKPVSPTAVGRRVIEEAQKTLMASRNVTEAVKEQKSTLKGTFKVGILPTIAPYLLPRFFPKLMAEYPQLDLRIIEMKTQAIKTSLDNGGIDAALLAADEKLERYDIRSLFYEKYFACVAQSDHLSQLETVRTPDLIGEYLWLLDEGHCFRDQLVKFCHLKDTDKTKRAYTLGSIETFMRIVESGKGVTFIPELATLQLTEAQKNLVRPFASPVPTREVVLMYRKDYIRSHFLDLLEKHVKNCVPQSMLQLAQQQKTVF